MDMVNFEPFGAQLEGPKTLGELSSEKIRELLLEHHVLIFKGLADPSDEDMLKFCGGLGEILQWSFGPINELKADPESKNYIYTNSAVPFHWDGAFVGKVPFGVFFHCREAGPQEAGGATLFSNTAAIVKDATPDQLERWRSVKVTYSTEKLVHYGGSFSSPIVSKHPYNDREVIRYAEPVEDLNPVSLSFEGLNSQSPSEFIDEMKTLLYDPRYCYAHSWSPGDIVLADNHTLLHGRAAYQKQAPRHLRRVNIL